MLDLKVNEKGVYVKIKVQPRASKNEIKGIHGDALKVRLMSPPVDGAANSACQSFFAEVFNLSPSQVSITHGLTSRNKTLFLEGLPKNKFLDIINKYI
ncbi:MAG: DUF167 domain-containing protein [Peptococcaceae bacterium]